MIENRHLRYFSVLARTLHMTRAAEELHIAQPALTQNIQQLEQELGVALLKREGKRLSLTEAGKAFLFQAERSLQQFEYTKVSAQKAARGELGRLALGFGSTAGVQVVPSLVKRFRAKYPNVDVQLCEMGTEAQLEAMERGTVDVGIAYAFPREGFDSTELAQESLVALLYREHRFAKQKTISLEQLTPDALILPSATATLALREAVLTECAHAGWKPHTMHEIQTAPAAFGLVSANLGVALLPEPIICMNRQDVVICRIRDGRVKVRLRVLWRKDDISPVVENFLRLCRATRKAAASR